MQPPQGREAVAQVVQEHEREVGEHQRQNKLGQQRPLGRPEGLPGREPGDGRDQDHAVDVLQLIGNEVQDVGRPVAVRVVPLVVPGRRAAQPRRPWRSAAFQQQGEPGIRMMLRDDKEGRARSGRGP